MELIILPFCVPLLLLGYLVDAVAEHRRRRHDQEQRALDEHAWRETWFRLNGAPTAEPTASPPSPPRH